jgi:hypothetical protein
MTSAHEIVTRLVNIRIVQYRNSDLLVALSDDLKGLMVPGRSEQEIANKVPDAVREIFEAQGFRVVSVTSESENLPPSFVAREFVASAKIEAVH